MRILSLREVIFGLPLSFPHDRTTSGRGKKLAFDRLDRVEIDTEAGPPQAAIGRHVVGLDIHAGGAQIERALRQSLSHGRGKAVVDVYPAMALGIAPASRRDRDATLCRTASLFALS